MKLVEVSENGMRVWMRGDRHRIVQFVVRDEQNKAMITTAGPIEPAFERDRNGGRVADGSEAAADEWIGSVQISSLEAGSPKTLEVLYALGMEETAYPFHVAVPE